MYDACVETAVLRSACATVRLLSAVLMVAPTPPSTAASYDDCAVERAEDFTVTVEAIVESDVDVLVAVTARVESVVLVEAAAVLRLAIREVKVFEPAVMLVMVDSWVVSVAVNVALTAANTVDAEVAVTVAVLSVVTFVARFDFAVERFFAPSV